MNGRWGVSDDEFGITRFTHRTREERIKNAAKRPLKRQRMSRAPQVVGASPIVGIRVFRVDLEEMILCSLSHNSANRYFPGEDYHATCPHANKVMIRNSRGFHGQVHSVPEYPMHRFTNKPLAECTCGVWACKSRRMLHKAVPAIGMWGEDKQLMVSAQVQLWGVVIEHDIGYRAEWARIIPQTISRYPRVPSNKSIVRRWSKHIAHLREKYNVDSQLL